MMAASETIRPYRDHFEHLEDELRRLDLLIRRRVLIMREQLAEGRGTRVDPQIYISHEEVDRLLDPPGARYPFSCPLAAVQEQCTGLEHAVGARLGESLRSGIFLPLPQLGSLFGLSRFELETVIVCLAPELHRKYDRLYAYLQDDITRKRPSIDLVLDLLCESESDKWRARAVFSARGALMRAGILEPVPDAHSPSGSSGLAQFLELDARVLRFILGHNELDGRLLGSVRILAAADPAADVLVEPRTRQQLSRLICRHAARDGEPRKLVVSLHGPYGVEQEPLARSLCGELRMPLVCVDMPLLMAAGGDPAASVQLALREGLFFQGALFLDQVDVLFDEDASSRALVKRLANAVAEYGWLVFLAGKERWPCPEVFHNAVFQEVELPVPDVPLRAAAWRQVLERGVPGADAGWPRSLAARFRLTPGQIRDAAALAGNAQAMSRDATDLTLGDFHAACRAQSNRRLAELAVKIEPRCAWSDLILPHEKLVHLKEICSQVRQRALVFEEWGFERKLSRGKGLSALFFGPPGTGKTMAAEVIAHDLELDLYEVDLSGVVSKYIGETEKNLSRIFREAETSNAILFFDEADALFGKRTEVSDAHDRYANIETSYLLQKMEEYEGLVLLATNLRENMDEAFTRRIRFVIEFPFPDAHDRRAIWRGHFPPEAPVGASIDFDLLASRLPLTGGNIKNIVLNAAFLAAENGGVIEMEHVVRGSRREFEKIGKLWNEGIFGGAGK